MTLKDIPRVTSNDTIDPRRVLPAKTSDLLPSAELAKFKEAQAAWERLDAEENKVGNDAAGREFRRLQDVYAESIAKGDYESVKEPQINDREQLHAHYKSARIAFRRAKEATTAERYSAARAAKETAALLVEAEIVNLATNEEAQARRFGLQYVPSNVVGALFNLVNRLRSRETMTSAVSPKNLLGDIVQL